MGGVLWDPGGYTGKTYAINLGLKTNNEVEALELFKGISLLKNKAI